MRRERAVTLIEREILACIAAGLTTDQTARIRQRSAQTVRNERLSVYRKLGATNQTRAIVLALKRGMITFADIDSSTLAAVRAGISPWRMHE